MKTHKVIFSSVHPSGGKSFEAEADAPTEALAIRSVLEAVAAQGIQLECVVLADMPDLSGAVLDGLKLSGCTLRNVNLQGASLRGTRIERTTFEAVYADASTHFDSAQLEAVSFVGCTLNGLVARGMNAAHLKFTKSYASDVDATGSSVIGLRNVDSSSTLARWKHEGASIQSGSFDPQALFAV